MTVWTAVDSVKRLSTVKTTTTRDRGDTATVSPVPKKSSYSKSAHVLLNAMRCSAPVRPAYTQYTY